MGMTIRKQAKGRRYNFFKQKRNLFRFTRTLGYNTTWFQVNFREIIDNIVF